MALLDMGAEYHFYGSDITCSFPVSNCVFHLSTCLKLKYKLIYCVSLLFMYVCLLRANELLMSCYNLCLYGGMTCLCHIE